MPVALPLPEAWKATIQKWICRNVWLTFSRRWSQTRVHGDCQQVKDTETWHCSCDTAAAAGVNEIRRHSAPLFRHTAKRTSKTTTIDWRPVLVRLLATLRFMLLSPI